MQAVDAIELAMATLLAADTGTIDAVAAVKVALVKAPFAEGPGLVFGDLTLADFTGSTPLAKGAGAPTVYRDPGTLDLWIEIPPPAGGWHWVTGDLVNLPQTIYGFACVDNAVAALWGAGRLPQPLLLNAAGVGFDIPPVRFPLRRGSVGP